MAATYGVTNLISSFGFCRRWREQCVALAGVREGEAVYDLMSGMGECWPAIARRLGEGGSLTGLDFSREMCRRAAGTRERLAGTSIVQLEEDFLANSIPDEAADCVVSCFGLKTFSPEQRGRAAAEIARVLRPGGRFCLLEISVPPWPPLRGPYMFYLKRVVPLIGALLLGNPDNYRLLGVYTEGFGSCEATAGELRARGLEVETVSLFFGCATALRGRRPA
jgi:demethylmenaquinone methyltransferase/2-methoxy-6-polyprenyl-1,4-benzoquinol methylase